MKWMWLAVWLCTLAMYAVAELRIAAAEQRAAEAEAWADAVQNEFDLVLEKARAGR